MTDGGAGERPPRAVDLGVSLRLAGVAVGLICVAALFGSVASSSASPGSAPVTGVLAWLLNPISALMGVIGAVFLFVVGALVSASRREDPDPAPPEPR